MLQGVSEGVPPKPRPANPDDPRRQDLARLGSILFGIDVVSSLHHPISYNFSVESKGEGGVHESDSRGHATF